ncbi:MAG: hypothetical protein COW67_03160 [Flavobacteriales bacterium CG18_big_fil_WC_8_21_14_2_50_32_9]|nr:MAG: hypothetical protein COW67_03160 [Flavobacteriales bacterium CG18_big_fil_WC_8_21_14_2_50_32_9]PJC61588.1 MAG: hypothetical protein CO022_09050 [Flavobacteriales bacterium CG_4_9_14_0_2_um_filter_32_27]
MQRTIRLIWDFRGNEAEQTAKHHQIHLEEFASKEQLILKEAGVEKNQDFHWIAFLLVDEREVFKVRDALQPVRAEVEE